MTNQRKIKDITKKTLFLYALYIKNALGCIIADKNLEPTE